MTITTQAPLNINVHYLDSKSAIAVQESDIIAGTIRGRITANGANASTINEIISVKNFPIKNNCISGYFLNWADVLTVRLIIPIIPCLLTSQITKVSR